jgi:hypothetical protein
MSSAAKYSHFEKFRIGDRSRRRLQQQRGMRVVELSRCSVLRTSDTTLLRSSIGVADELPVHYRGGVGKSAKRRVGGGT